jgi:hypothetical protein
VVNTTFNNISVLSWQSDLLVEEYPEEITDLPQVKHNSQDITEILLKVTFNIKFCFI